MLQPTLMALPQDGRAMVVPTSSEPTFGLLGLPLAAAAERCALRKVKVAVVGFGYVGSCIGAVLAHKGFLVHGIEVDPRIVAAVRAGRAPVEEPGLSELIADVVLEERLTIGSDLSAVSGCEVVLVTVGTPLGPDHGPDLGAVIAVAKALAPHLRKGHLVILKSTVVPKTTTEVVVPLLQHGSGLRQGVDFGVAFCPERFEEGNALRQLRNLPVVVGATSPQVGATVAAFWESAGLTTMRVASPTAAELVKLADNLWIDLNIALANELALLAAPLGVDALEVIAAANTLPKGQHAVNIMTPGAGVGGSCLTKDPYFVHQLGRTLGMELRLPLAGRAANEAMPAVMATLAAEVAQAIGKAPGSCAALLLGISFKPDTDDIRGTTALPLAEALGARGFAVLCHDPCIRSGRRPALPTGAAWVDDLLESVRGGPVLVLHTAHGVYRSQVAALLTALPRPGGVVDGRFVFDPQAVASAGHHFRGIGRPPLVPRP